MTNILSSPITTRVLRDLQTNQARKLLFVNMATMALPRIYIDSHRNKYAGQETAVYEVGGILNNYALPGLLAMGSAAAMGKINNPLGVKLTRWAKPEYVESLAELYKASITHVAKQQQGANFASETLHHFIQSTLENLEGVDPLERKASKLSPEQIQQFTVDIYKLIKSPESASKASKQLLAAKLAEALGSFDSPILKGRVYVMAKPDILIQHLSDLGQEFQKSHTSPVAETVLENFDTITHKLQRSNVVKSGWSLAIVGSLGFGTQFFNRWMTKRRTGKTGFVGYSDFAQPSNAKGISSNLPVPLLPTGQQSPVFSSVSPALVSSANPVPKTQQQPRFSGLVSSQFLPTVDQLKYWIYPLGMTGRILASRDFSEFRELVIKSTFGFANFLLIPNLVENLVAHSFKNKNIFAIPLNVSDRKPEVHSGKIKQSFQKLNNSSVRSYQDIEVYAKTVGKRLGGKSDEQLQEQLSFLLKHVSPELQNMSALKPEEKAQRITAAVAKELNHIKNVSSLAGVLYSCLTLGIGLNVLSIYITNKGAQAKKAITPVTHVQPPALATSSIPSGNDLSVAPPVFNEFNNPFQ